MKSYSFLYCEFPRASNLPPVMTFLQMSSVVPFTRKVDSSQTLETSAVEGLSSRRVLVISLIRSSIDYSARLPTRAARSLSRASTAGS